MTREAEARVADGERERGCERGAGDQPYPGRHSGVLEEQRRGVRPRAKEGGLPEGDLAGESAQDVPSGAEQRIEEHQDHQVLRIRSAQDERVEEHRDHHGSGEPDLHSFPNKPRGRSSTTTR